MNSMYILKYKNQIFYYKHKFNLIFINLLVSKTTIIDQQIIDINSISIKLLISYTSILNQQVIELNKKYKLKKKIFFSNTYYYNSY